MEAGPTKASNSTVAPNNDKSEECTEGKLNITTAGPP